MTFVFMLLASIFLWCKMPQGGKDFIWFLIWIFLIMVLLLVAVFSVVSK